MQYYDAEKGKVTVHRPQGGKTWLIELALLSITEQLWASHEISQASPQQNEEVDDKILKMPSSPVDGSFLYLILSYFILI